MGLSDATPHRLLITTKEGVVVWVSNRHLLLQCADACEAIDALDVLDLTHAFEYHVEI